MSPNASTPRTGQIDHDLDHLVRHLPFGEVVQDLHRTDPTQEACARLCRLYTGPTQQHELGRTNHTDNTRSGIDLPLERSTSLK